MGHDRLAAHMGISLILLLAAVGGWGAFGYGVYSARQQERAFRDEIALVQAERGKLAADLDRMRQEAERSRQALERAQAELRARPPVQPAPSPVPTTAPAPPAAAPKARPVR